MNTHRRSSRFPANSEPIGLAFFVVLLTFAGITQRSFALTLDEITREIWRMNFGVTPAQIADSGWMAADADGDGISNGSESVAGTNPFSNTSTIRVISFVKNGSNVEVTFPTLKGKEYQVQRTTTLAVPASWTDTGSMFLGIATTNKMISVPYVAGSFYRVEVSDHDSDGDNASDWAERIAGYNENNSADGGNAVLSAAIATSDVVTVTVTRASATQPVGLAAPVETGSITVSRGGPLKFHALSVPIQKSGTAVEGTDYESLPASPLVFPIGVGDVVLPITPKANANLKTNVTAIVKALAGPYTLGSNSSGSVVINPAGLTSGTGLTAKYHNASSLTYSPDQTNIFAGTAEMSRTDAVLDFGTSQANTNIFSIAVGNPCVITTTGGTVLQTGDSVTIAGVTNGTFSPSSINGTFTATVIDATHFTVPLNCTVAPDGIATATLTITNGWGATGGPWGMIPASANQAFSVRWTGQILPRYSETYFIDFRSDDSAKVWVNGKLLIDRWAIQNPATDYVNSIALQANTLYDIQIDYWNNSGSAEAKLFWWSPSQPKEIIPQSRLFPAPSQVNKSTAITSSLSAVGYVGQPFTFYVTSSEIGGAGTTYALAPDSNPLPPAAPGLPARLNLDANTGVISGIPAVEGTYNVAVNATNVAANTVAGSSVITITIFPVGGVTREILGTAASNKVSDIVIPTGDPGHDTIPTIDDDTNRSNNTGVRLRGYFTPPKTGNYYFWLAANNAAELWISNDSEYVNRVLRASVSATTGYKIWDAQPSQRSAWLSLVAGEKYYFEVLHNTGSDSDDHVAVGWCQDDIGTVPSTVTNPNPTGVLTSIPNGGGGLQGYPYSGTIAGFACQPYDYPSVTPPTGTLYACNLGPQGSVDTSASGSANLQVNAAETQAILHFNYQNLGSPKTAYHLHVDGFTSSAALGSTVHPNGEIIFDIDDADQDPSQQTADGGYVWNFGPIGSFTGVNAVAQLAEAIKIGKVYLNVHSVTYPNGEIRGNMSLIEGSQTPPAPYAEPAVTDSPTDPVHAARFLNQATFGASPTELSAVAGGFGNWVDDQLTRETTHTSDAVVAGITSDINNPYPSTLFTNTWWANAITAKDQLRQRLAFALSEIMVVSWANDTGPLARNGRILADYYDQLLDYCLPTPGLADSGTFRGILKAVTLTPAMGRYLDMLANQKGDITVGRSANENYGREILQLFSVGIYRLWDDGRYVLGSDAGLVPTYLQPNIVGVSNLLTGWHYAQAYQANGRAPTSFGPAADFLNPMVLVPRYHEQRSKLLLNRVISPAATGRTPRIGISSIASGSPACTVTTSSIHGLKTGDTVLISGVGAPGDFTGGLAAINTSFQATVTSPTTFTVPVQCNVGVTSQGTVTGTTVLNPAYSPPAVTQLPITVPPIPGSQADESGTGANHPFDVYGLKELEMLIDNIVNNDNVPPYICRQLIQRFVTSDPSPGYVYRVVQKFKNNGSGVRGDLAAVVRQILTDGEARSSTAAQASTSFGKQREPMLRLTGVARAFPSTGYTGTYTQLTGLKANRLQLLTSTSNDFNAGFPVALNFRGNYVNPPAGQTVDPYNNPTTTTYSVAATTAIAATHLDVPVVAPDLSSPTTFTTTAPHGLTGNKTIWFLGLSGKFSDASINSGGKTATSTGLTTFTVPITVTHAFQVQSVAIGTPCTVTTVAPHGLPAGVTTGVTINGVTGGVFSGGATSINGTNFRVTNTGPNTFTVQSSTSVNVTCSAAPTAYTTWRMCSNPVRVTTQTPHGLANGDTVTVSGVSGGSFSPSGSINGTYAVSEIDPSDPTGFTVATVSCISPSTPNTGNIVGSSTLEVTATGMVLATYTQTAGSATMTVNTAGPQTNVPVPNPTTTPTLKSKVYMTVLSRSASLPLTSMAVSNPVQITKANHGLATNDTLAISGVTGGTFVSNGVTSNNNINKTHTVTKLDDNTFTVPVQCTAAPTGAGTGTGSFGPQAADGVYEVQANGSNNFTVFTADTPTATRTGSVLIPKIPTSYTPTSLGRVQFNTNVNHNLNKLAATQIWVDAPLVSLTVLNDAEYTVPVGTATMGVYDEDHFWISNQPTNTNGGTYPAPSGSTNSVTVWPLVPAPQGRSGSVAINQSTFALGSTESTLTQSPLNSPTVFNFFLPDYKFPGTLANNGLDSPEFQLSTDSNMTNLTNSLTNIFIATGGGNGNLNGLSSFNAGNGSVVMNIAPYMAMDCSNAGIPALIDTLANLLVAAPLNASTKTIIQNFVANTTNFPYTTPTPTNQQKRDRVRAIIDLIITSAEYAVQK